MNRMGSLAVAAILASGIGLRAQSPEEAARQFVQQYEAAYNKGDAQALARLHGQHVLRLGSDGRVLAGRAEIEKEVAAALSGPRKGSKASIQLARTQVLKPDVTVIEGPYEVTGGSAPVRGRYLITLHREDGEWRIASIATVSASTTASQ